MKRFIFSLLLATLTGTVYVAAAVQPDRKEQKAAAKKERAEATARTIDSLILIKSFQFNPTEVMTNTGYRESINKYEYVKVFPGNFYTDLVFPMFTPGARLEVEGFFSGNNPYTSTQQKGKKWQIRIDIDYHTGILNFEFVIDRPSGLATLRIRDRNGIPITYRGSIYPN